MDWLNYFAEHSINLLIYMKLRIIIVLSVILIGFSIRITPHFFYASLKMVETNGVIITTNPQDDIYNPIFALTVGLIPILIFTVIKITRTTSIKHAIVLAGLVLTCGFIGWLIRVQYLINYFNQLAEIHRISNKEIFTDYNSDQLNFEYFIAFGTMVGYILSIIYLGNWKKKKLNFGGLNSN
ncbi:MAG: hypothetical protein RJQ09_20905 [Cyclobacteriaceae bacterium]